MHVYSGEAGFSAWSEIIWRTHNFWATLITPPLEYPAVLLGAMILFLQKPIGCFPVQKVILADDKIEEVEKAVSELGLKVLEIPREALFLTGKVYLKYRKNKGTKSAPLPDFFIGAHASV